MKHLSKNELDATCRIFQRVNALSGDYYGKKLRSETEKYVSRNRWIMFPTANIGSLREGVSLPVPNVFVSFNDEIKDDGQGKADCYTGANYGSANAMAWLRDILRRTRLSTTFLQSVNAMGDEWEAYVAQKIHTGFWGGTPVYRTTWTKAADNVTLQDINAAIDGSDQNLLKVGELYKGEEVVDCVSIFGVNAYTDVENFDNDVKDAFALFTTWLSLR
jgi:hypothetical protein